MNKSQQTQTNEQLAADAQLLAYVKELQDLDDVYQLAGYGNPRHITQPSPRWDWYHYALTVGDDGLMLCEFSTTGETRSIEMEPRETEHLLSVLLDWYLKRRIQGIEASKSWEPDDTIAVVDHNDEYRDLTTTDEDADNDYRNLIDGQWTDREE